MYRPIDGGTVEAIQGLECNIPPIGYIWNFKKDKLEKVGVYNRASSVQNLGIEASVHQYWQRPFDLKEYKKKRREEKRKQSYDKKYSDHELNQMRIEEWRRRLYGFWFMNKGEPTYITGLHYFYLTHWYIGQPRNDGYPDYWDSDRKFFYFLEYAIQDPRSLGVLYVTKRRSGKSAKSAVFLYEYVSRTRNANAGIQSKTDEDAKKVVYIDGVLKGFKKLPDFFKPIYDTNKGAAPTSGLDFIHPVSRGKNAREQYFNQEVEELDSHIFYTSSKDGAFDGTRLTRYVGDEVFKDGNYDVRERHNVNKFCCTDTDGKFSGKMLLTSTVEYIEGKIDKYIKFWDDSDPSERAEGTGRTRSGLYRYFLPSDEARDRDKYGFCDIEKNRKIILADRNAVRNSSDEYLSLIRKEPLSAEEAFQASNKDCIFDSVMLNDRFSQLAVMGEQFERGNFVWENGEQDSKVKWVQNSRGRFKVFWLFDDPDEANNVRKAGNLFYPNNKRRFVIGIDPYDHYQTVDKRSSNGAAYVMHKHSLNHPELSNTFVVEYISRPKSPKYFYEDMIKLAFYFGAPVLFEDNKQGIRHYFEERGYYNFLMHLPNRKEPGIPGSPKTHQSLAEATEDYIVQYLDNVYFPALIQDWLEFNIANTTRFDAAMAAGYTLLGDERIKFRKEVKSRPITSIFKKRRAG